MEGGRQEVLNAALEFAKNIAGKSPVAAMGTKKLLSHVRDNTRVPEVGPIRCGLIKHNLEYTVA